MANDPSIRIELSGELPSKKNAWKRGYKGQVYIDKRIKGILDVLSFRLIGIRNKARLKQPLDGELRMEAIFYVTTLRTDLDNIYTTFLDLLQKTKIIKNDRLIYDFSVRREKVKENPRVEAHIFVD